MQSSADVTYFFFFLSFFLFDKLEPETEVQHHRSAMPLFKPKHRVADLKI